MEKSAQMWETKKRKLEESNHCCLKGKKCEIRITNLIHTHTHTHTHTHIYGKIELIHFHYKFLKNRLNNPLIISIYIKQDTEVSKFYCNFIVVLMELTKIKYLNLP
jgi:hypothetical protein